MIRSSIYAIHVQFYAGTWIGDAAIDLVALANSTGHRVTATFNDRMLSAAPGESDEAVLARHDGAVSTQ